VRIAADKYNLFYERGWIMETVRGYLLSITITALCCGVLTSFLGKKGICASTVKFLCGVVMILAVVGPILNVRLDNLADYFNFSVLDASVEAEYGQEVAKDKYIKIIKDRTAAYILDKAKTMGAELTVEVTLSDAAPLVPCAVKLSGNISPYTKKVLSNMIAQDLGIDTEAQVWST